MCISSGTLFLMSYLTVLQEKNAWGKFTKYP